MDFTRASNRLLAVAIVALAGNVVSANAQTPPLMRFADTAGNVLTVDSTGSVFLTGNCTPATCQTFSAGVGSPSAGAIDFSGTVGGFTIYGAQGQTNQGLVNETDLGLGTVLSATGGQLTVSLTVSNVSISGPLNFSVQSAGGSSLNSTYIDPTNTLFGTSGTPVVQLSLAGINGNSCPSPTNCLPYSPTSSKSSVTEVAVIQVPAGGPFTDDLAFFASSFSGATTTPPLTISCAATTTGTVGIPYSSSLTALGGTPSYTYSIASGSLPPGLTLTKSTGGIAGTPTTPGTFAFTAGAMDSSGNSITGTATSPSCSITVSPVTGQCLAKGDTATIGFWHNKNGQALMDSLNGGPTSKTLAAWLATTYPKLYGASSANNLTGKTNADVAKLFLTFFGAGGAKTNAQILGGALAAYVTNTTLAGGNYAGSYGFNTSATGTGVKVYNVGADGPTVGLTNGSYTINQLLTQANLDSPFSAAVANAFNNIFDGINQAGDIN